MASSRRPRNYNAPKFWKSGGGGLPYCWAVGWWAGPDGDLLCIKPDCYTRKQAENSLSPVCLTRAEAVFAFVIKRVLMFLDLNMRA